ncbi:MAG TPA: hypothetical protein VE078_00550 [Thermoanaerobaculia bacterium]|nr:hypothetical protein [Thermoanaerobaculia bacterium]
MRISTVTIDELRETYFYDTPENVTHEFPTVNRDSLLMAAFDGRTEDLAEDLWGWTFEPGRYRTLWYSSERRAAFLQFAGEVYLFTFADASSFLAGVSEIHRIRG